MGQGTVGEESLGLIEEVAGGSVARGVEGSGSREQKQARLAEQEARCCVT